ncbi:MAG TPA: hypothetical protein PLQ93_11225 [Bacteroidia bacterium]|nr:hypothetical protein [Bacteroidia bacterium]
MSSLLLTSLLITLLVSSCGPAAEDRATMVSRAKEVQDSIANMIRSSLAEAEGTVPATAAPATVVTPSSAAAAVQGTVTQK